jgi:hypothetical protein
MPESQVFYSPDERSSIIGVPTSQRNGGTIKDKEAPAYKAGEPSFI